MIHNDNRYLLTLLYWIIHTPIENINTLDDFESEIKFNEEFSLEALQYGLKNLNVYLSQPDLDYNGFFKTGYSNAQVRNFLKIYYEFLGICLNRYY